MFDFSTPITRDYTFRPKLKCGSTRDGAIVFSYQGANVIGLPTYTNTVEVRNLFSSPITINGVTVQPNQSTSLTFTQDDIGQEIILDGSDGAFTSVTNYSAGFFNNPDGLPSLFQLEYVNIEDFLVDGHLGDNMFRKWFNDRLIGITEGGFDTRPIKTCGNYCFYEFLDQNYDLLKSLPQGSFQFPNLTSVGTYFMGNFWGAWGSADGITALPVNSFNWPMTMTAGSNFLYNFGRNSNLARPGNGMVCINAANSIYLGVGGTIAQGNTVCFNGE